MQRAVVATPLSIGGLRATNEQELLVREAPADFARAVVNLLGQPDRRRELGMAGRRTACEQFAWQAKAESFESLLMEAARTTA
jgi:glycosyltransferase involved in cell wall biosynthesis